MNFQEQKPLSELSTLGVGGPARYFIVVQTVEKMQELLSFCILQKLPYIILGKGSNCLFDDAGFDGVVIANKIDFCNALDGRFHVGAGYSFSLLGVQTARQGFSGLEFASGIPGSVGGAVYMNAGANGAETAHCLESVDFVQEDGTLVTLDHLTFSYRTSPFQSMRGAIVGATFLLKPAPLAREKQLEIVAYRKKTQPLREMSAGCIFRNPTDGSAGALIEQCGLKGLRVGGAEVSSLHANFLINTGNATSQDMIALMTLVKERVKEKTGIDLEIEVRHIHGTV